MTRKKNEEVRGTVKSVWYPASTKSQGNNFCIVKITDVSGELLECVGSADEGTFAPNLDFIFQGYWKDTKYGRSFQFCQYSHREPHTRKGLIGYLTKYLEGVGPVAAQQLVDKFSEKEILHKMKTDPQLIADSSRLNLKCCEEAADVLNSMEGMEETNIQLGELLKGRGFRDEIYKWVPDKYGIGCVDIIKKRPFILLIDNAPGAGFSRCDLLYLNCAHDPNALERQMFGLWAYFDSSMEGHTWFPLSGGEKYLTEKLDSVSAIKAEAAMEYGIKEKWLAKREIDGETYVTSLERANDEAAILRNLEILNAVRTKSA